MYSEGLMDALLLLAPNNDILWAFTSMEIWGILKQAMHAYLIICCLELLCNLVHTLKLLET